MKLTDLREVSENVNILKDGYKKVREYESDRGPTTVF